MTAFLVTGYRTQDLGIFSERDPKIQFIKKAIRKDLIRLFEDGVNWLVFQGNLGFEYWCLEVALELVDEYSVQLACIFPFEDHGRNWSEANQVRLAKFKHLDYVNHSFLTYLNSNQLRQHQDFLLNQTQGLYVFYDLEHETTLRYLYQAAKTKPDYEVVSLNFERLNELAWEEL